MEHEHRCEAMMGRMFWITWREEAGWVMNIAALAEEPITHCPFCGADLGKEGTGDA